MAIPSSIFGTYCLRILGGWAVIHGLLTFIGGIDRWRSPVYDIVRILPGSPYSWAIILIFAGTLVLIATIKGVDFKVHVGKSLHVKLKIIDFTIRPVKINYKRLKNAGLWIIAGWTFIFSLGLMFVATIHPELSLSAGTRDWVICALSVMMTKAVEPRYVKNE